MSEIVKSPGVDPSSRFTWCSPQRNTRRRLGSDTTQETKATRRDGPPIGASQRRFVGFLQPGPQRRVGFGPVEEPLDERLDVEVGPADDDRPPVAPHLFCPVELNTAGW